MGAAVELHLTCGGTGVDCPASRVALIRLAPGATLAGIEAGLSARYLTSFQADAAAAEVQSALATPVWAGQDGMLSMGFLVALGVATTGYLL